MWPAVARFYEIVSRGGYVNVNAVMSSPGFYYHARGQLGQPALVHENNGDVTGLEGELNKPGPNPALFVPMHFRIVRTGSSQTTQLRVRSPALGETRVFDDAQTVSFGSISAWTDRQPGDNPQIVQNFTQVWLDNPILSALIRLENLLVPIFRPGPPLP